MHVLFFASIQYEVGTFIDIPVLDGYVCGRYDIPRSGQLESTSDMPGMIVKEIGCGEYHESCAAS